MVYSWKLFYVDKKKGMGGGGVKGNRDIVRKLLLLCL